jgi:hypothetical protein
MRQVARGRQHSIVLLDRAPFESRAERPPELADVLRRLLAADARIRREDGHPAIEEIGACMIDAVLLRAGERMSRDILDASRKLPRDSLDDVALRAPAVGEDRTAPAVGRRPHDAIRDAVHRYADHDEIGRSGALREIGRVRVDRTELHRPSESARVASHTHDPLCRSSRLRRQADRATNKPHADDGDLLEQHVGIIRAVVKETACLARRESG